MDIKFILSPTERTLLTVVIDSNDQEDLLTLLALPKTDDDGTDKHYVVDRIYHVYGLKAYGSGIVSHTREIHMYLT